VRLVRGVILLSPVELEVSSSQHWSHDCCNIRPAPTVLAAAAAAAANDALHLGSSLYSVIAVDRTTTF